MRTKFTRLLEMSDEALEDLLKEEDHTYVPFDAEEVDSHLIHSDWDCETCDAELLLQHRRYLRESLLPGACSIIGANGKGSIHHNISAEEMQVGHQARYLSRPGVSAYPYEYAEALEVTVNEEAVKVTWRRTNSPEETPFTVTYSPEERLNVCHYL